MITLELTKVERILIHDFVNDGGGRVDDLRKAIKKFKKS